MTLVIGNTPIIGNMPVIVIQTNINYKYKLYVAII